MPPTGMAPPTPPPKPSICTIFAALGGTGFHLLPIHSIWETASHLHAICGT